MNDKDTVLRVAAFDWLTKMTQLHGDVLNRRMLEQGFIFESERIPLISPQGKGDEGSALDKGQVGWKRN